MLDKIKQQLPAIRLGKNQKSILMGAAAILVTGAIIFSLWRSSQGYTALFGSQEHIPVTQVVEVLDGEAIAYRINPDNGQILVAENQLGRARILLAAKGITATLPTGYELMDQETMLGSSQFIQNVRYKRSLEGELAQSIMALTAVDYARVHLGMSEASSFAISNRSESSASVILRLKYGQTLKADQVGAIVQLVAGSIPGMKAANVRVVDQHGELLSEAYQANGKGVANVKNGVELAHYLQSTTEKSIANLLSSVVGVNNYRISVATQLDLSRIEETLERYGAEPRVSDENIQQENGNEDMAMGIPGSLSNQPSAQPKNANAPAMMSRSQAQRKYAYDRDIRHVRHPGFKLEKMTVAVILNKSAPALEKWTPEQLNELKRLIEDAAGIDVKRGDSLTLNMLAFTVPTLMDEPVIAWWQDATTFRWVEIAGIGLLSLLFLLFGVRPLMARLSRRDDKHSALAMAENIDGLNVTNTTSESSATTEPMLPGSSFKEDDNLPPQGSGLEIKISHLQQLAQSETERVAEVIKQWINNNERIKPQSE
ncbi:flagellar M-ring protein FliF [Yersinia enterocolitica]|uniref:Flagellar M-ring protein n=1 Tax=Yersinia enterocolitica TaxID=630 RepID=A0A9P1PTQ6_YEREN|nr:flagellar basal-body MS-ring/collar protein FliF [Yersinia enterocolitica]EKN3392481.1 flagellar M-ring protein FliF [Yersinia enterocolitica]EKN3458544.1 flagellar M-ring protein FliF [Yersinia enterocolitica]EKN3830325.1 flagellar M-ring protein FliF [Yersinia enterocolitica]EKN3890363.1 flagellar M-ring protein FliF [Yersinia enterocolitica]EKN3941377.1 flagellar M-ring protein FliF [Yersinia enterocolitica]